MITTKHASNSPVMFVTHESFAVLLFLPCCVNSLSIIGALFWTTILCNSRSLPWTILCIPHPFTWPYLRGAFVLASGVFITLLKGIQNRLYVCDACVSRSPHADDTRTVLFVPSLLLNYGQCSYQENINSTIVLTVLRLFWQISRNAIYISLYILYTFQQQKCFMENAEAIWTCIFKIRFRVKMEMCFCDYLLCVISSICASHIWSFSSFRLQFSSRVYSIHGSGCMGQTEVGAPDFKWQEWSEDFFWVSNFRFWDFFLVGKFGQVFFGLVWFIKFGFFFAYSKQSENLW